MAILLSLNQEPVGLDGNVFDAIGGISIIAFGRDGR